MIIGTDEAGRGPLAGPVYAAAVVLPPDFPFEILNDSKKLSEKKRNSAEKIIKEKALYWSVAFATPAEIDRMNILQASLLAMKRAVEKITDQIQDKNGIKVLIDGNQKIQIDLEMQAIVKGDSKIHEIMAASILAKTERDRFMSFADRRWPLYEYAKHKGYPTARHMLLIEKYGPSPIQRMSFKCKTASEKNN